MASRRADGSLTARQDPARLSLTERAALARAPRVQPRALAREIAGKIWNSPNTALGLGLGSAGYLVGQLNRLRPGDQADPRIQIGHNAVEFINNPATPLGALTLGNTTIYGTDPDDPNDRWWGGHERNFGHPVQEHEEQHTYQGEQLGPAYLPSNILGGLTGLIRDGDWHGPSNWNERGPRLPTPRPWPPRQRK